MQDARQKGKNKNAEKTHCKRGHPFTKENTYPMPRGGRSCRICLRAHISRSEKKKRQLDPEGERKKAHDKYLRFKATHPGYVAPSKRA